MIVFNKTSKEEFVTSGKANTIIRNEVEIPVYAISFSYLTNRDNYKSKTYYFFGSFRYDDFEYLEFNMDDIKEKFELNKHWTNIHIDNITPMGKIFYLVDKNNYMTKFSQKFITRDNVHGSLCELMKKTHPKNIIFEEYGLRIPLHEISYSYETKRGSLREKKSLVFSSGNNVKEILFDWINSFNAKYPYRSLSNVKILDNTTIGTLRFE